MIATAWYMRCDRCGNPAEISTEDRKDARRLARYQGFKRIDGQDVCPPCQGTSYEEAAMRQRLGPTAP